jgi:hypothetical protein
MISPTLFGCLALLQTLFTDQTSSRIIDHIAAWIILVFGMIAITASRRSRDTHRNLRMQMFCLPPILPNRCSQGCQHNKRFSWGKDTATSC